jgi:hypothetical protein
MRDSIEVVKKGISPSKYANLKEIISLVRSDRKVEKSGKKGGEAAACVRVQHSTIIINDLSVCHLQSDLEHTKKERWFGL